jgi:hypothetical protein
MNPKTQEPKAHEKKHRLKGVEVQLSDGAIVLVHDLRPKDVKLLIQAMPAMSSLAEAVKGKDDADGVQGLPVDVSENLFEATYPLLSASTDIPEDELRNDYSLWEILAFLRAFNSLMPKNLPAVTSSAETEPVKESAA